MNKSELTKQEMIDLKSAINCLMMSASLKKKKHWQQEIIDIAIRIKENAELATMSEYTLPTNPCGNCGSMEYYTFMKGTSQFEAGYRHRCSRCEALNVQTRITQ